MARPRKNPLPVDDASQDFLPPKEAVAVMESPEEPSIVDLLERASESQKEKIRKALNVSSAVKAPRKQTNADAAQVLAAHGGGTFQKPGFVPVPPQGVSEKGPAAIAHWLEQWEDGQTFSSRSAERMGVDAETLAAVAVE